MRVAVAWRGESFSCLRNDPRVNYWARDLRNRRCSDYCVQNLTTLSMRNRLIPALIALALSALLPSSGEAQTLRLQQAGSGGSSDRATVQVGQTITIEVFGDLGSVQAAGIAFFITLPSDAFQVIDQIPDGIVGVQPFTQGPLFQGAGEPINLLLPENDPGAQNFEGQQLDYAAVVGVGGQGVRTGTGVVATFRLLCVRPIINGRIDIDDNPVRETRLVLSDGQERRFITVRGMEITVTGLELRDIPDVILSPGQTDSIQIGSLTKYVSSTLAPPDSIRWSFDLPNVDPAIKEDFLEDSLAVEIEQLSHIVKITPLNGWAGRQRVIWTATEPSGLIPGEDPNQTIEISDIVVNSPPVFSILPGPDGVKRDTIRIIEDAHPFTPGIIPDRRVAFRGLDLDQIVDDSDVIDSRQELSYLALPFGSFADTVNVRADDDPNTHELLVWSRQNYFGVDSLKVVVFDAFRGQDSLRVIIEVLEASDPPEFILQDREPKVSRGGTRSYLLNDIARDVDTPLDSLELSWTDDPEGRFTADTTRTEAGLVISITGKPDFSGLGRVTFQLTDPSDPENLSDIMEILITAAEALPPVVFPPEIKIFLISGEEPVQVNLDDFVEDPDNIDSELAWKFPSLTQTVLNIDENRVLSASSPIEFVGYEEAILIVSDPGNQSDELKIRIYSSYGDLLLGGLPDLILDRGQQHSEIDLDNYYFDANNTDEDMTWRVADSFDMNILQVGIDPLTRVVTFLVDEQATFRNESVIFQVTSPDGKTAQDTMLVTIRPGGAPSDAPFQILPLPLTLEVMVGSFVEALDLDNFVQAPAEFPKESLTWEITALGGDHTIAAIGAGNVMQLFGVSAGTDTIAFTARDSLGNSGTQTTFIRAFGESDIVNLLPLPDVQFVAGTSYTDSLNKFIVDRVTHRDSSMQWSIEAQLHATGNIFPRVQPGNILFVAAPDTGEVEIVLVARDTVLNVSGRDTIKIIALDPATAARPLKELPPIVLLSGQADSTILLNEFLPDGIVDPGQTIWRVSGQEITTPSINVEPPHRLTLQSVGDRLGLDTLSFVVDFGGGLTALGTMEVTVQEPTDESTLELQVLPNMFNQEFIDIYVIARRGIAGTPNVIRTFEGSDSTVAVRQIEEDLAGRKALVWSGNVHMRPGASGTIFFTAQALTVLGTPVGDTASVTVFTTVAAKASVIEHKGIELQLEADAVREGTRIIVQVEKGKLIDGNAKTAPEGELELRSLIDVYPMGTRLLRHSTIRLPRGLSTEGLYRQYNSEWQFLGITGVRIPIEQLGRYAVFNDTVPPSVMLQSQASHSDDFAAVLIDRGSGIDLSSLRMLVNGEPANAEFQNGQVRWWRDDPYPSGPTEIVVSVEDRVGNRTIETFVVHLQAQSLPARLSLEANYPNPFNPETTIPFAVPASSSVRVSIYNVSGQLVRRLVDSDVAPGQHEITWDAKDENGTRVSTGVYFYRLESADAIFTRSMMLLK